MSELLNITYFFKMKSLIAFFVLASTLPVNAFEKFGVYGNRHTYNSRNGYAYENKCFRYEYREQYIPGNSMSPGYVKSYHEKVSIPCNSHRNVFKHYNHKYESQNVFKHYNHKYESQNSYVKYKPAPKCTESTMLGGLIGGGIAASLSKTDAYAWSIPLGAVLGAGIGNAECK